MRRKTRQEREIDAIDRGESAWKEDDEIVDITFPKKITVVTPVRLPSDKWVELKAEAEELGVGASTLIRMWVLEKLRATRRAAAPPKRASTKSKAVNKRRSA